MSENINSKIFKEMSNALIEMSKEYTKSLTDRMELTKTCSKLTANIYEIKKENTRLTTLLDNAFMYMITNMDTRDVYKYLGTDPDEMFEILKYYDENDIENGKEIFNTNEKS